MFGEDFTLGIDDISEGKINVSVAVSPAELYRIK